MSVRAPKSSSRLEAMVGGDPELVKMKDWMPEPINVVVVELPRI